MRIEPYQGGYRMVPSTSATSPIQRARDASADKAAKCDTCDALVSVRDVDRVELSSLAFQEAQSQTAPATAPIPSAASQQRLRERLVAGIVDGRIDLDGPGRGNAVLNRAYFLSERAVAEFNAAAVGNAIDVSG